MSSTIDSINISDKIKETTVNVEQKSFSNEDTQKEFTNNDKKKIVSRIKKLKNKKKYIKLFNIINKDYDKYTFNDNGVFVNLNDLQTQTLKKIITFLDKNDQKKKRKKMNYSMDSMSDSQSLLDSDSISVDSQSLTISFVDNIQTIDDNVVFRQDNKTNNKPIEYENDVVLSDEENEPVINEIKLTNIEKKLF